MKKVLKINIALIILLIVLSGCNTTQKITTMFTKSDSSTEETADLPEQRFIQSVNSETRSDIPIISPQRVDTRKDILPVKRTQQYLQSIVDKLVVQWPHEKPEVNVYISSKKDYSAMAGPDDSILVRFDILEKSETEDEIAFILAHELAHILLNHAYRASFQDDQRQAARIVAKLSRVTAMIEEIDINESVDMDVKEVEKSNAKTYAIYDDMVEIMRDLFNPVWARSQEDDADLLAIDLMVAAGYNPESTLDVFDRFESYRIKKETLVNVFTDNLKNQAASLLEQAKSNKVDHPMEVLTLDNITGQAKKTILETAKKEAKERLLTPTHRKPLARKQTLEQYYMREYPNTVDRDYQFDNLEKVKSSREIKQATSTIKALINSRIAFHQGDIKTAKEALNEALKGKMASFSDALWLKYQISRSTHDYESAISILEKAQKGQYPGIDSYEALFTLYWKLDRIDDAMKLIQAAEKRYEDHDHFRPEKIFLEANSDLEFNPEDDKNTTLLQLKSCENQKKDYLHCVCKASGITSDPEFRQKYSQILYVKREQEKQTQNRFFKAISDVFDMTSGACG